MIMINRDLLRRFPSQNQKLNINEFPTIHIHGTFKDIIIISMNVCRMRSNQEYFETALAIISRFPSQCIFQASDENMERQGITRF